MTTIKKHIGRCLFFLCAAFPALRPALRPYGMRVTKWLPNRPVRIVFRNGNSLKLTNVDKNYLSFHLFWMGAEHYEPITRLAMEQIITSEHTFLDIGANIGFFSLNMARNHPEANIFAFEPNPKLVRILAANIEANSFRNIVCEPVAMSDREGEALLFLSNSDMSASLETDFDSNQSPPVKIERTTLDRFVQRMGLKPPLLLKVDVEGHERAFFAGAQQTIATYKPDMICEVAILYKRSNPFMFLKEHGYYFYKITNRGLELSESVLPVIDGHFFFPNYFMSTKTPDVGRNIRSSTVRGCEFGLEKNEQILWRRGFSASSGGVVARVNEPMEVT